MVRVLLQQSVAKEPGTWYFWAMSRRVGVIIVCPLCSKEGTLVHQIRTNGDVEPSVRCSHAGCDWHEFVRLEDWPGMHLELLK